MLFHADELAPRIDRENLSAWFTPADLAWRVIEWCGPMRNVRRVLEPSAGSGSLIEPLLDRRPNVEVVAHELAPNWAAHLRRVYGASWRNVNVVEGDYLSAPSPEVRYDLAPMNPPYEGGLDGEFVEKTMCESDRVVAILRLVALVGQARTEEVWSRCSDDGYFALVGLALFSGRPRFEPGRAVGDREADGSAKTDFCVVKLRRRDQAEIGRSIPTQIEWWQP